jgi:hypothetical protein
METSSSTTAFRAALTLIAWVAIVSLLVVMIGRMWTRPPQQPPAQILGHWEGSWSDRQTGETGSLGIRFLNFVVHFSRERLDMAMVRGEFSISGPGCPPGTTHEFSTPLLGNSMTIETAGLQFTGEAKDKRISGTFKGKGTGDCLTDRHRNGTWSVLRTSS